MKTVRRLYFYAIAFISFEVVLWGLIGLIRSIVNPNLITNNAQALAQALSLILVGVPIFLVHWLWAQHASAREDEEKTAAIRAVFLYGALFGTLIPAVQNLLALINRIFLGAARISYERALLGGTQSWPDNLIAITLNLLLAGYFWSILRAEWKTLPDVENFKDIRRLYRYLWMLYGLLMIIFGAQQILRFILYIPTDVIGSIGRETFINATALLLIGAPVWFFSWRFIQNALPDPAEKGSIIRLGILYLLSLGGTVTVLTSVGSILFILFSRLLGDAISTTDLVQKLSGPISIAIPFGALWSYYGNWLGRQFAFEEDISRRSGMKRIYFYILSAIGLTTAFIGANMLFSFVIDVLLDFSKATIGDVLGSKLAGALAVTIVGLPLWLMTWRPMQADALADGEMGGHARRSVIRKAYLYLALFASVLGTMGTAAAIVFQLIQVVLTGNTESNFLSVIFHTVQAFVLFLIVLVYHLSALRKDSAARSDALEEKQSVFNVVAFTHNVEFGGMVDEAFVRHASKIHVTILNAAEKIPADLKANAIILPGSLAVNLPENIEVWTRSFNGSRLIVADDAADIYWMNDFAQAAQSARALAEGQKLRPQSAVRTTSLWTTVAYVFAALFALQLVFVLLTLGISLVAGF